MVADLTYKPIARVFKRILRNNENRAKSGAVLQSIGVLITTGVVEVDDNTIEVDDGHIEVDK